MKPKHPPAPPMTLGNMRELGRASPNRLLKFNHGQWLSKLRQLEGYHLPRLFGEPTEILGGLLQQGGGLE